MILDYFKLENKKTTVKIEFIAGLTTFLTMAYIIFVNPDILSSAGMDKASLIAVTCIVSAVATIFTGLFANAPIAMAPGMGLNAFFAYSLVITDRISWETALGIVFLSGLFFMALTVAGLRRKVVEAIPGSLVSAISVGIGLFITFIGLVNLGIIVKNDATIVSAGSMTPTVLIGLAGLLLMIILESRKVKGALVAGIIFSTILGMIFGYVDRPSTLVSFNLNIKPTFFRLDIMGALKWSFLGSIFTLMFMDMFDSIGTLVACSHQAGMVDGKGSIKGIEKLLALDAGATMFGAVMGTSTTTAYIESASGIEQGGRSGLTSVFTGMFFLFALLFIPLVGIVPSYATAGALVMVGLFMMKEVKRINFSSIEEAFPAFIIMVMIALSYSISTGLAFGFISFTLLKLICMKAGDIKPVMWIITALSVLYFLV